MTVREVANEVSISIGFCCSIFTDDLGMKWVSAKWMPKLLTMDQIEHRIEVYIELRNRVSNDQSFIESMIPGDETWVYGYDPETKAQSSHWKIANLPRPKINVVISGQTLKQCSLVFFDFC